MHTHTHTADIDSMSSDVKQDALAKMEAMMANMQVSIILKRLLLQVVGACLDTEWFITKPWSCSVR